MYKYNKGEELVWKVYHKELVLDVILGKNKNELIRIVKNKDGEIFIDKTGKANGRGAYICNNISCLEKAVKSKRLERVFETKISEEIYESLRGVIIDR